LPARNPCIQKFGVVGLCIVRLEHQRGKPVVPAAIAIGKIVPDERIVCPHALPRLSGIDDGKWFKIGVVGEKDAAIPGAERMERIRRDSEAERFKTFARHRKRSDGKDAMIDRAGIDGAGVATIHVRHRRHLRQKTGAFKGERLRRWRSSGIHSPD